MKKNSIKCKAINHQIKKNLENHYKNLVRTKI